MPTLNVYWRIPDFDVEEQNKRERRVPFTGLLSDEHDAVTPEIPVVLIEERSNRVYRPGELPPDAVLYIEDHPGPLPPLADQARQAGFRVDHAANDAGLADHPQNLRTANDPEERGQPRHAYYQRRPTAEDQSPEA